MVTATTGADAGRRATLLVLTDLSPEARAALSATYVLVHMPRITAPEAIPAELRGSVRAVLTNGMIGLSAAMMDGLPSLELACVRAAGHENVDLQAARSRNIAVASGSGANASTVADHAMALLLAIVRGVPQADAGVRAGKWAASRALRPTVSGKRLGILGLGTIGSEIARRGAMGFGMRVAYHNRGPRPGTDYAYCETVPELAEKSDFLVVAAPGGAETRHLVDAAVCAALGPDGYLVNVGRGSIVDTHALIDALRNGRLAGAALDVIDGEPEVPAALLELPNVVLTPHLAGRSLDAHAASLDLAIKNLDAHFSGRPLLTPVVDGSE